MSIFQKESNILKENDIIDATILINEKYKQNSLVYEYTSNAEPIIKEIKPQVFTHEYFTNEGSYIYKLNNQDYYNTNYECTSPALLSSFIRIESGVTLDQSSEANYSLYYVQKGEGETHTEYGLIKWKKGDIFSLPNTKTTIYHKNNNNSDFSLLYCVDDSPLLNYLNETPKKSIQKPVYFSNDFLENHITSIIESDDSNTKNRTGVLLSDLFMSKQDIITLSPILWSLYNIIEKQHTQKPHRHNSVAIDLCTYASEGELVYTLMSKEIDNNGNLINPIKCVWKTGCVFVTPPGWWHSHHNESNECAYVFPVQDAGLHTYLRTLDINFS